MYVIYVQNNQIISIRQSNNFCYNKYNDIYHDAYNSL